MADGELTLRLDDEAVQRLKAAAESAGRSIEDYVLDLIHDDLEAERYAEALEAIDEYERTGESVPVEQALAEFRTALDERLAGRR